MRCGACMTTLPRPVALSGSAVSLLFVSCCLAAFPAALPTYWLDLSLVVVVHACRIEESDRQRRIPKECRSLEYPIPGVSAISRVGVHNNLTEPACAQRWIKNNLSCHDVNKNILDNFSKALSKTLFSKQSL